MLMVLLYCILCLVPLYLGAACLAPLDHAARFRRDPIRYHMVDFLGLMFLLTVSMAALRLGIDPIDEDATFWLTFGCIALSIVAGIVWAAGVTTISRAGINEWKQRALLVFFVLPAAFAGTVAIYVSGISLAMVMNSSSHRGQPIAWLLLLVSLLALQLGAVSITRRIAKEISSRGISPF